MAAAFSEPPKKKKRNKRKKNKEIEESKEETKMLDEMITQTYSRVNFWLSAGYLNGMDLMGQKRKLRLVSCMYKKPMVFPNRDALAKNMRSV